MNLHQTYIRYLDFVKMSDTSWGAQTLDLPGCAAVGKLREEALQLVKKAIDIQNR